ncbi:cytochrome P450 [Mycena leptocephala]|nr:cytochrome P450 [Mycena leptocephala]
MSPPPGIVYLFGQLPNLVGPPLAVSTVPNWELSSGSALAFPHGSRRCMYIEQSRSADCVRAIPDSTVPGSIGGIDLLRANTRDLNPGELLAILARDLGFTFSTRLLFNLGEIFKTISSQEAKNFEKGTEFRQIMFPLLGTGLFNADGDMWKCIPPKNDTPILSPRARQQFRHLQKRWRSTNPACARAHPVDVADIILRFTLDDTTSVLFNHDLHCLDAGLRYPHYVSDTACTRPTPSLRPPTRCRPRLDGPMGVVRAFLDPILREAFAKKRAACRDRLAMDVAGGEEKKNEMGESGGGCPSTFEILGANHLLNMNEQDHSILGDEIMNITAARRERTAALITVVSYMLAEHPEVMEKLRSEILRVLKYLRSLLNETLRLYPSVSTRGSVSVVPSPATTYLSCLNQDRATSYGLADEKGPPICVPIGGKILVSQFVMHRRTDLWGLDALEFDPERFLDERLYKCRMGREANRGPATVVSNPFIFVPFNAGEFPSVQYRWDNFAYHEASFFVVRLLQTFSSIALAPDAQPPPSWKTQAPVGWKAHEEIRLRSHFTIYVELRCPLPLRR